MLYTVRGLENGVRGVTIRVRVLLKEQPRTVKTKDGKEHEVVEARVGDRTGTVTLTLWDERTGQVSEGDILDIENGYVNRFKGRPRLNVGMYGEMHKIEDPSFPTAKEILEMHEKRRRRWSRR